MNYELKKRAESTPERPAGREPAGEFRGSSLATRHRLFRLEVAQ